MNTSMAVAYLPESLPIPADVFSDVLRAEGRQLKKALRRNEGLGVVLLGLSRDTEGSITELVQYLRDGLGNVQTRVIVLADEDCLDQRAKFLIEHGVDCFHGREGLGAEALSGLLAAERRTFQEFSRAERRRAMEVSILTTLGKLSRSALSIDECLRELLQILFDATGATLARAFPVWRRCRTAYLGARRGSGRRGAFLSGRKCARRRQAADKRRQIVY